MSEWTPLTRDRQDRTQEELERIIGMSEAVFAASVFSAQGARHFADPAVPPRERKQLLTDALGLERWERYLKAVRADIANATSGLNVLRGSLAALEEQGDDEDVLRDALAQQRELAGQLVNDVASSMRLVKERREALRGAAEAAAALATMQARVEQLSAVGERVGAQLAQAEEAQDVITTAKSRLSALAPSAAEAEALEERLRQALLLAEHARTAAAEQASLRERITETETQAYAAASESLDLRGKQELLTTENESLVRVGSGICPHCEQPLYGDHLKKAVEANVAAITNLDNRAGELSARGAELVNRAGVLRNQLEALTDVAGPTNADIEELRGAGARAADAAREVAVLQDRIAQARAVASVLDDADRAKALRHAVAQARQELADANREVHRLLVETPRRDLLQSELDTAEFDLRSAEGALATCRDAVARTEERLRAANELAGRRGQLRVDIAAGNAYLAQAQRLEHAYGANGIPALILEATAIPQLEQETQRILREFDMPFRVELVTQRETKSGTLKDTLDVVVHEPAGARPYGTFSGGERSRIERALRIALARLVATRNGNTVGFLALDEPEFLDETGQRALVRVLRGLAEFRSVVLVTHDETLADADFDERLVVVRDAGGARLEAAT